MGKKVFLMDVSKCCGCYNCQIACKDEHCGVDWLPYAKAQPETGQFWCKVDETVHGTVPKVNITYEVNIGAQDEAIREYAPECLMERDDDLIVLDPEKCKGRRDIADMFDGVYWNETLDICQGCTGCAHLIDDGWEVPRCVDICHTGALRYVDESECADEIAKAERLTGGSHVYYLNLPKRWIGGEVYDEDIDEVIIGAKITLSQNDKYVAETESDRFGDFWFRQIEPGKYTLYIEAEGYTTRVIEADTSEKDHNVGSLALYAA